MSKITYFFSGSTKIRVAHLIFEQDSNATFNDDREGEVNVNINRYLDIDLKVEGQPNKDFSLFVQVNGKNIGAPSLNGEIRGKTDKDGHSRIISSYIWF